MTPRLLGELSLPGTFDAGKLAYHSGGELHALHGTPRLWDIRLPYPNSNVVTP